MKTWHHSRLSYAAIIALVFCLATPPLYAQSTLAVSSANAENTSRIYPSTKEIFSPRIYGSPSAPNNVALLISPGSDIDEELFADLYPLLQPLVAAGKVRLEIRLWEHIQTGFPFFLVAQCLDPAAMPLYLYEVFASGPAPRYAATTDEEEFAVQQALRDPRLTPSGLSPDQLRRRLNWCMTKRRDGMIYAENSRFNSIYNWGLKNSGILQPAVIVNQKIFDGDVEAQEVMKSLQRGNP